MNGQPWLFWGTGPVWRPEWANVAVLEATKRPEVPD